MIEASAGAAAILAALAGAAVGSFAATLVQRWGQGRTLGGRSACDGCGRRLGVLALVPVLGFVAVRGRCAACGHRIDRAFPATELAAAGIGALALALQPGWAGAAGAVFGWTLLTLALLDARYFWLPDRLVLPLLAAGLAAGAAGLPPPLADRAIGAAAGCSALWLVAAAYRRVRGRDGLGGGDAKLFAAIGAWLGWAALPGVLLAASLLGLGWIAARLLAGRTVAATDRLPLGTLLAVAAGGTWIWSAL